MNKFELILFFNENWKQHVFPGNGTDILNLFDIPDKKLLNNPLKYSLK